MGSFRSKVVVLSLCVCALVWTSPAFAEDPPPPTPPGTPSIDQYVETVPTSQGGASTSLGKPRKKRLPDKVATQMRTIPDRLTQRLETAATSSTYGAPKRDLPRPRRNAADLPRPRRSAPADRGASSREPEAANPVSAAVSAVSDSGDSHMFWLLAAVIIVTTTMVWTARQRT
jgi:hypothetical protein